MKIRYSLRARQEKIEVSSNKLKGLRKGVFSKQTSIYYRVNDDYIEVISFRSNRKDPGKFSV